jgi:hypothetical protein
MSRAARAAVAEPAELNIGSDKVFYIVTKAREYDAKVAPVEPDPGSNPTDSGEREILEDYADDPTAAELREAIDDLNEDEVTDLIAMVWLGRGDFGKGDWAAARRLARERHRQKSADYLMGTPTLGDLIEEGFTRLGHSFEQEELDRL